VPESAFWDKISNSAQDAIIAASRRQILRAGQTLMTQGDRSDRIYLVMEGWIKICVFSDYGTETTLEVLGSGHLVGEMSVIDGEPRGPHAVAISRTEVQTLSGERFRELIASHPEIARAVIVVLSERLTRVNELRSVRGALPRVATLVRQLARRYGSPTDDGGVIIAPPLTREEIASWAGVSRRQAGRTLGGLRLKGAVRLAGHRIVVSWKELRRVMRDIGQDHDDD
jgi:CRP/FNR family cyclic AMP-dependent transcriptional regulator